MFFSVDISALQWLLFQLGVMAVLVALVVFAVRVLPLRGRVRKDDSSLDADQNEEFEKAAIIVYSHDEDSDLARLLPQLLEQDYPVPYEVVVVNEGESAAVSEVVGDFQLRHNNLYLTCTPDGVRNLSRKKLAITLGVKATRMPVVALTTAGSCIDSTLWLRSMMRHFRASNGVEVVLGFAAPPPYDDRAFGARARAFDFVADSAAWVSPAIKHHPWRGTEHNLAYRRDLFFRNKGFSRHLNLRYGDDDIFVSEITDANNTAVELSDDAFVTIPGANSPRAFRDEKTRRSFTGRFIRRRPRVMSPIGFICYALAPLPPLVGAALSPTNWFGWALAAGVLLLWYLTGLIWHIAVKALRGRRMLLTLPFLASGRPVRKLKRGISSLFRHGKRYTWE